MKWASLAVLLLLVSATTAEAQVNPGWASAETLLWWVKDGPAPPPLATTAPANSSGPYFPGSIGNADTTVVLGNQSIAYPMQVGGRFTLGTWLGDTSTVGVEGNYLFLGQSITSKTVASDGSFGLYNPILDVTSGTPTPTGNVLTQPGVANHGSATLITSHELQGGEINALYALARGRAGYMTLLGGYRTLYVNESLTLATTQYNDGATTYTFPGEFCTTTDLFNTRNYFNGGQLGIRGQWNGSRGWFLGGTFKTALGSTHEVLQVRGSTTTNGGFYFTAPAPTQTVASGIYAQSTNIGKYSQDRFAVLPEVSARVGRQITPHLQLFVGYDFLYLSNLARPGNQIDGTINSSQAVSLIGLPQQPLVGEARPAPRFIDTSYWAQGVNLGAQIVW